MEPSPTFRSLGRFHLDYLYEYAQRQRPARRPLGGEGRRALGSGSCQLGGQSLGLAIADTGCGNEFLRGTASGGGSGLRVGELDSPVEEHPDLGGGRGMLHPVVAGGRTVLNALSPLDREAPLLFLRLLHCATSSESCRMSKIIEAT